MALEAEFLMQSGAFVGSVRPVSQEDHEQLTVELISEEAMHTSEIEGQMLNRESLQSSIRRNFGLATDNRKVPPAEVSIAQMMAEQFSKRDASLLPIRIM